VPVRLEQGLGAGQVAEVERDDAAVGEHGVRTSLVERVDEVRTLRLHADDHVE